MDKEQLISEVFRKTAIWDQCHKSHHNRYVLEKCWEEVAANSGITVEQAKKSWKVLRQQFKVHFYKSSEGTVHWPYFKSMMFLKDVFEKRPTSGNTGNVSEDDDVQSTNDHDIVPCSASTSDTASPRPFDCVHSDLKESDRKRARSNDSIGELLEIERDKIKIIKEKMSGLDKNDEDVAFFTSLLPHVRKLSPVDKMVFRLNVQKMLLEKVYGVFNSETMHSAVNH
ncbi:uncharacterized protein [Anabrus simplex]|uniref:uncharacterized protein n=1 Tax=Anabrus simplex TaxID=316456 RepID=UPI0035A397F0